jgi:hypothetical protein
VKWKIYYADGTTFSDHDGSLKDAPAFGVLCVVCDPDLWGCGDLMGLVQYLMRTGLVKFGQLAPNEVYKRVLTSARSDPDFDTNERHVYERGDYYWFNGTE